MPDWLRQVTEDCHEVLTVEARAYLKTRGVTEADVDQYDLGFSLPSSVKIKECTPEFKDWSDRYLWNKLTFPLTSATGEVIGVQVRSIITPESGPKYQQFYCYTQEVQPYFFPLHIALPHIWQTDQVVIVEGIFDYFALKNLAPNTLAILTSGVPLSSRNFFRRYVRRIFSALDMDKSGRESTQRLQEWGSSNGVIVQALTYSKKDPGELAMGSRLREVESFLAWAQQEL